MSHTYQKTKVKRSRTLLLHTALLILLLLAGCGSSTRKAPVNVTEVAGTIAKRVEVVTAMLTEYHEPPTPLVDAQFAQEQIGDGELGPSDYRAFVLVAVAPEELGKWQDILTPLAQKPSYTAPSQPLSWWITEGDFDGLQFYAPDPLTGRTNGWVAINEQTGQIYIYSFTT